MSKLKLFTEESHIEWYKEGGEEAPAEIPSEEQKADDDFKPVDDGSKSIGLLIIENWASGSVVALVAIPLSFALAIASECTPVMGLISAIYGPMVGGLFGGSDFNVIGPAASLTSINAKLVVENGIEIIPYVAMLSGGFILWIYLLKLEQYVLLIPFSVLEGFSFGIATTIAMS
jgi:MFS superfamily sulfate permease-like transporter